VEQFQYLPEKGEQLTYKGYTFQVQQMTNKKIVRVLIIAANPENPA
jgi:CBS domain containing-hemolysin-like protein